MRLLLCLILSFCSLNSHGAQKILIKANILLGENFGTARTSAKEIEEKVGEVFSKKGYEIVNSIDPSADILYVDLFVYQFFGQFPAVTITIRTENGIHYIDQDHTKFFVGRNSTNLNLATELAERIPDYINKDAIYKAGIGAIISSNKTNSDDAGNSFKVGIPDYYSIIKWGDNNKVPFVTPKELELYLFYAANYTGMRKLLAGGPVVLKLRINKAARFELINISSKILIEENQRERIQEFIDSFPLWMTNTEVENIEIMYGIK